MRGQCAAVAGTRSGAGRGVPVRGPVRDSAGRLTVRGPVRGQCVAVAGARSGARSGAGRGYRCAVRCGGSAGWLPVHVPVRESGAPGARSGAVRGC